VEIRNLFKEKLDETKENVDLLVQSRQACEELLTEYGRVVLNRVQEKQEGWRDALKRSGFLEDKTGGVFGPQVDLELKNDVLRHSNFFKIQSRGDSIARKERKKLLQYRDELEWVPGLESRLISIVIEGSVPLSELLDFFICKREQWVHRVYEKAIALAQAAFEKEFNECVSEAEDGAKPVLLAKIQDLSIRIREWNTHVSALFNDPHRTKIEKSPDRLRTIERDLREMEADLLLVPVGRHQDLSHLVEGVKPEIWAEYTEACKRVASQVEQNQIKEDTFQRNMRRGVAQFKGEFETTQEYDNRISEQAKKERDLTVALINEKVKLEKEMSKATIVNADRVEQKQILDDFSVLQYDADRCLLPVSFAFKLFSKIRIPVVFKLPREIASEIVPELRRHWSRQSANQFVLILTIADWDTKFNATEFAYMASPSGRGRRRRCKSQCLRFPWIKVNVVIKEIKLTILGNTQVFYGRIADHHESHLFESGREGWRTGSGFQREIYSFAADELIPERERRGPVSNDATAQESKADRYSKNVDEVARSHGYSDYDDYSDAYWNGESDLEMGDPW